MSKISVIIPMYNVERFLRRCLDSVKNQTFQDWQAICVDDGSPDKSGSIAEEYAKTDKRFIVIHKENGGLSDARNAGMEKVKSEYVMFLDSDDFIHPQTMEIVYEKAKRNKSDIVSFSYDRFYRPRLMVRHVLRLSTDNVIPFGIKKRYNIDKIKTKTTDDVFELATERTHNKTNPNRKWLIKHCQVWKNLYKKSLIKDTPFIKGILFEDFPWWSAIMLKQPRVTVVSLPLYFYTPNFSGIVLSAKQLKIIMSLFVGIEDAFVMYKEKADEYQIKKWMENFLWFFIARAYNKIKYLKTEQDLKIVREGFIKLKEIGVFNSVPDEWYDLCQKIYGFIRG